MGSASSVNLTAAEITFARWAFKGARGRKFEVDAIHIGPLVVHPTQNAGRQNAGRQNAGFVWTVAHKATGHCARDFEFLHDAVRCARKAAGAPEWSALTREKDKVFGMTQEVQIALRIALGLPVPGPATQQDREGE